MSIKKRKFDSIEKMLSFPKYITLDNDTLTLKNCIINFDFSLVNFISTISPQSIVCVSNEQKETEDTGSKGRKWQILISGCVSSRSFHVRISIYGGEYLL